MSLMSRAVKIKNLWKNDLERNNVCSIIDVSPSLNKMNIISLFKLKYNEKVVQFDFCRAVCNREKNETSWDDFGENEPNVFV